MLSHQNLLPTYSTDTFLCDLYDPLANQMLLNVPSTIKCKDDHCSDRRNFCSRKKKAEKKWGLFGTSAIALQRPNQVS